MINFGQLGWYLSAGSKKYDQKRLKQGEGWFVIAKLEIWVQAGKDIPVVSLRIQVAAVFLICCTYPMAFSPLVTTQSSLF